MPPEDLDAKAARLLADAEHLEETINRKHQALEWAGREAAAVRGTASSTDGLLRATVDRDGVLLDLELAARARQAPAAGLAKAITGVVQRAVADARLRVRRIYQGLLDEGVIDQLPPLPEGPRTAPVTVPVPSAPPEGAPEPAEPVPAPEPERREPERGEPERPAARPGDTGETGTWFDQRPWPVRKGWPGRRE